MEISLYTDGSATTKDLPGGWAYVIVTDGIKHSESSGSMLNATNNDAELEAVVEGLKTLLLIKMENPTGFPDKITLFSDSEIVLNWIDKVYRFKQLDKIDKYNTLIDLSTRLNVETRWVKGHSGNEHNERCDELANIARKSLTGDSIKKPKKLIGLKQEGTSCFWYKGVLKIVDFDLNLVQDYNQNVHGLRESKLEIK